MKIIIASTPATGHLNPLLAIGRFLIAEGHELAFLSGSVLRSRIEAIGAKFHPLPNGADFDLRSFDAVAPELKTMAPGHDWLRVVLERVFVDTVPAQHEGLQQVLRGFPADIIIVDNMFLGALPMLLGDRSKHPPIVVCGTSFLAWSRQDGAPHFIGLPPATTEQQRDEYAAIYRELDTLIYQPVRDRLNRRLRMLGVGPMSMPLFEFRRRARGRLSAAHGSELSNFRATSRPRCISSARLRSFPIRPRCHPGPTTSTARARWCW